MKQQVTEGIILSRINYGEADRIITILTSTKGKIRLIAKGVRKIKSRLAGGIELFSINDITYISGKGDLGTLVSSRLKTNFGNIVKDVSRTMFIYDVLKMFNKITEDALDHEYFLLLLKILSATNDDTNSIDAITLWMNMQLLKTGGHSPNLNTDTTGEKLNVNQSYVFSIEEMAFSKQDSGPFNADYIKLLRLALSVNSASKVANVIDAENMLPPLVQLSKTMLQTHMHAI